MNTSLVSIDHLRTPNTRPDPGEASPQTVKVTQQEVGQLGLSAAEAKRGHVYIPDVSKVKKAWRKLLTNYKGNASSRVSFSTCVDCTLNE